jgi:hypothetical protein
MKSIKRLPSNLQSEIYNNNNHIEFVIESREKHD